MEARMRAPGTVHLLETCDGGEAQFTVTHTHTLTSLPLSFIFFIACCLSPAVAMSCLPMPVEEGSPRDLFLREILPTEAGEAIPPPLLLLQHFFIRIRHTHTRDAASTNTRLWECLLEVLFSFSFSRETGRIWGRELTEPSPFCHHVP